MGYLPAPTWAQLCLAKRCAGMAWLVCKAAQGNGALVQALGPGTRVWPMLQGAAPDIGVRDAVQVSHMRDAHNAADHHRAGKAQHVRQQLAQERRLRRLPRAHALNLAFSGWEEVKDVDCG